MRRTLAVVVVLALGLWLAGLTHVSAQEPTPTAQAAATDSGDDFPANLDTAVLIPGAVALAISLLGSGGLAGVMFARRQARREGTQDIWASYDRQIKLAEDRGDKLAADNVRLEQEAQHEAWRAQQGLESITPKEISSERDGPSLAPEEIEQLRQLLRQSEPLDPALLSADHYLRRGNAHYNAEEYTEALQAYDQARQRNPDVPEILNNRGAALRRLGRLDEALLDLNRALELREDYFNALTNRAMAFDGLNRHEEALADLDKIAQLKPKSAKAIGNRGVGLVALDRLDEAIAAFDRALELQPDYHHAVINRGFALQKANRPAEAREAFDVILNSVVDLSSPSLQAIRASALVGKGLTFADLGQHKEAVTLFDEVIELYAAATDSELQKPATRAHVAKGISLIETDDSALAIHEFDAAVRRLKDATDPGLRSLASEAFSKRGLARAALGDHKGAIKDYQEALTRNPLDPASLNNSAISLHHLGHLTEALDRYSSAIAEQPQDVLPLLNRASLETEMGDTTAALADLTRALNQGDLAEFRREHARRAATHSYFDPLRKEPSLRELFEELVAEPEPAADGDSESSS